MRKALKLALGLVWVVLLQASALAHSGAQTASFENRLGALALRLVIGASVALGLLSLYAAAIGTRRRKKAATKIFAMMLVVIVTVTVYLIGSTVYLNSISYTKGPVHWHADFEIWACGRPVLAHNGGNEADELKDPQGFLSNKIGSPSIHEHDDRRLHIEGVLLDPHEATLGHFISTIGGELTPDSLTIPAEDGSLSFFSGEPCGKRAAELQVFVYKVKDKRYTVTKLNDPENYQISPYGSVPPGDCVIFEFDVPKNTTDKVCLSYEVAKQTGKIEEAK